MILYTFVNKNHSRADELYTHLKIGGKRAGFNVGDPTSIVTVYPERWDERNLAIPKARMRSAPNT